MNLLNRLSLALRAAASDLFSEEAPAPQDKAAQLLRTAQQRVDKLNEQLAQAVAREKRAEQDWRTARAGVEALEAEVDAAVRAHQDETARLKLAQVNQAQNKLQQLSDSWKAYAASSEKLRIEMQDLHTQLAAAQQRLQQLGEREGNAGGMETLQQARREQRNEAAQVHQELAAREEQTARREDHIAAREELDQTRIADLLKKHDKES
jgi:phage shock protein A